MKPSPAQSTAANPGPSDSAQPEPKESGVAEEFPASESVEAVEVLEEVEAVGGPDGGRAAEGSVAPPPPRPPPRARALATTSAARAGHGGPSTPRGAAEAAPAFREEPALPPARAEAGTVVEPLAQFQAGGRLAAESEALEPPPSGAMRAAFQLLEPPPQPAPVESMPPSTDFSGRLKAARELLRACEEELKLQPEARRAARLHFEAARVLEVPLWDFAGAQAHFEAARKHWPEHVPTLQGLRRVYTALGRYNALPALIDAEIRATGSPARRAALLYDKACVFRDFLDEPREARSAFAGAVELDSGNISLLRGLELAEYQARSPATLARVYELWATALGAAPRERAALLVQRARLVATRNQDLPLATALYEAALKADENTPRAIEELKRLLQLQKRWNELVQVLRMDAARTTHPDDRAQLLFQAARVLSERLGEVEAALPDLEAARAAAPLDPTILAELGRAYEACGRHEQLAEVLQAQAAQAASPADQLQLAHRLGLLYGSVLGDVERAVAEQRRALAIDAHFAPAMHALVALYRRSENWEALAETYLAEAESAIDGEHKADALLRAADLMERRLQDAERAIGHYQAALAALPDCAAAFKALVRLYRNGRAYTRLVELYEREIERSPEVEVKRTFLFKLGRLYEDDLDSSPQAILAYRRVLEIEPRNLEAVHSIQRAAERAQLWQDLLAGLELEATLTRDTASLLSLWHRMGEISELELGDPLTAQTLYRRVLGRDEGHLPTLRSLGRLYQGSGHFNDLVEVYKLELKVLPKPAAKAALLYKMGQLCEQSLADEGEAIAHYRKAIQFDSAHRASMRALGRLLTTRADWKELVRLVQLEASAMEQPLERARAKFRVGELYEHRLGAADLALAAYDEALALVPNFAPALVGRLRLLHLAGDARRLNVELEALAGRAHDDRQRLDALIARAEVLHEDLKRPAEAAPVYEAVLSADASQFGALLSLEKIYSELGLFEELSTVYERQAEVLAHEPSRVAALRLLAQLQQARRLADGPTVTKTCMRLAAVAPRDEGVLRTLERLGIAQQDWPLLGRVDAQLAELSEDPAVVAAHQVRLGEALEGNGETSALGSYRQALVHDPESLAATRGLSRLASSSVDPELLSEAAEYEARVARNPAGAADLLTLGAEQRAERGGAVRELSRALEIFPDHAEAASRLVTLLTRERELDELLRTLTHAAQSAQSSERRSDLWIDVAKVQIQELRDSGAAIASAQRAVRERPDYPRALLTLANLYSGARQWREAVRWLREALKHNPPPALGGWAKLELGRILTDRLGEPAAALEVLEPLTRDPEHRRNALSQLVHVHAAMGQVERAVMASEQLIEASESEEQRAAAYLQLASLQEQQGARTAALQAYHHAIVVTGLAGNAAAAFRSLLLAQEAEGGRAPWNLYAQALVDHLTTQPMGALGLGEVHLELARVFDDRLGETTKALTVLRQGIAASEDNAALRLEMAQRLRRAGHPNQATGEYLILLGQEPLQPVYWRELSVAFKEQGYEEQSRLALGPLVALGANTQLEQATYGMRPARPEAARPGAFDAAAMRAVDAHPPDDAPTTDLFAALSSSLHKLYTPEWESYGVSPRDRIGARSSHPARVLAERVAQVLGVEEFDVYVHRLPRRRIDLELGEVPALMIPASFAQLSESLQVFLLARTLCSVMRKTYGAERLSPQQLRLLVASAIRALEPAHHLDGVSDEVLQAEGKRILKALPWRGRKPVEDAVKAYQAGTQTPLVDWRFRERVTAIRLAATLCDDLAGATGVLLQTELDLSVAEGTRTPEAELAAVLSYAVSDSSMQLRRKLGLALG